MTTSQQAHDGNKSRGEFAEVSRRREATLDLGVFPILVCKNERYWILDHFDRRILTRAEWLEIRENVDAFYDIYGDESIEEYNEPVLNMRNREATQSQTKRVKPSKSGYIYLIHGVETSWYKIGQSVSPKIRLSQLGTQGPFRCKLLHCFAVTDMDAAEDLLHQHFSDKRVQGEWFELNEDEIAMIRGMNADSIMALEMEANNG